VVLVEFVLSTAGCYAPGSGEQHGGGVSSTSVDAAAVPTATPVLNLPTPVILSVETPSPTPKQPASAAPTPAPAPLAPSEVETPGPTTEPTPEPSAEPTPRPAPAAGSPFDSTELVAALAARDLDYEPNETRDGCDWNASEVRQLIGLDGSPLSLWVYATPEDLKADWVTPSSGAPSPTIAGCEVDGGWIYWSENLVVTFEPQAEWILASAVREAVVARLWSLKR
jgi:hypothetical protein